MTKRLFDIVFASIGLVIISPLLLWLAIVIKGTSPGPILYRARRVGQNGKLFELYKFRSMVVGADKIGPGITHGQDNRITSIGRFLRHYKLDELPQLFNVLKGDMSFVGPRPEDPRYVEYYSPEQRRVLQIRPGITSWASISYRDESKYLNANNWEQLYIQKILPAKLKLDLEYVSNQSLWTDLKIIFQTLKAIVKLED